MRPGPDSGASGNPANRRRVVVVAITLVAGATLLGLSLTRPAGESSFYALTIALALVWAIGAVASGTLHLGSIRRSVHRQTRLRRPVLAPVVLGLLVGGAFVLGGLVVRQIPPLQSYVRTILAHADAHGALPAVVAITLANGVAEELFFRGALFAALGRHAPVLISTVIYGLCTATTANPMLVFAAVVLGALLALQRRASRGVLAPIITHLVWSTIMLLVLPAAVG